MADEKTIIMPDGQNNGGWGNIPAVLALNGLGYNNYPPYAYNNGGLFGGSGSGFGAGITTGVTVVAPLRPLSVHRRRLSAIPTPSSVLSTEPMPMFVLLRPRSIPTSTP